MSEKSNREIMDRYMRAVIEQDPRTWHLMAITEFRDAKVFKDTLVFGAPFEAPAWRAQWVERVPGLS